MNYRILLADDHKIIRDGLRALLEKEKGLEVAGEAENGRKALQLVRKLKPDMVIMDITMPDLNGVDATRQIVREHPGIRVIALSMHSDRQFVEGMLGAGVSAYLLKDCAFEELVKAVRTVISDRIYLSADIATVVVDDLLSRWKEAEEATTSLSTREREVLQLISEGRSTRKIAETLNISVKTVESHRRNIMQKLDLHSTAELTKYAVKEGVTSLDN